MHVATRGILEELIQFHEAQGVVSEMKTEQDADVEKRLLLAIVLSMAILFGTPYVYEKLNLTTPVSEPRTLYQSSSDADSGNNQNTDLASQVAKSEDDRIVVHVTTVRQHHDPADPV